MRRGPLPTRARTPGAPGTAGRGHVWVGVGGTRRLVPTHPARFAREGDEMREGEDRHAARGGRQRRRGHPRQDAKPANGQRHGSEASVGPLPKPTRDRGTGRKVPLSSTARKQACMQAERKASMQVGRNARQQGEKRAYPQRCMRKCRNDHKNARGQTRGRKARASAGRTPGGGIWAHGRHHDGRPRLARVCRRIRIWFRRLAIRRARRNQIAPSIAP
jgi:hypothetical protein